MPETYSLILTDVPNHIDLPMRTHNEEPVRGDFSGTFHYNNKKYNVSIRRVGDQLIGNICLDDQNIADLGECHFGIREDRELDEKLNESWEDYIEKADKANGVVRSYTKWNPHILKLTCVPDAIILRPFLLKDGVVKEYSGSFCYNDKNYTTYIRVDDTNYRGTILAPREFVADSGECHLGMINNKLNESWEAYLEKTGKDR